MAIMDNNSMHRREGHFQHANELVDVHTAVVRRFQHCFNKIIYMYETAKGKYSRLKS